MSQSSDSSSDRTVTAVSRRSGPLAQSVQIGGHTVSVDEPRELGGNSTGPTPTGLLAASLASCTAITLEIYAERKGWDIGDIEVTCSFVPAKRGAPSNFDMHIKVPRKLDEEQIKKLKVIAAKCPVHRTLEGESMFNETLETL